MEVKERTLLLGRHLWVQHGGVEVEERGEQVALTGVDDDSYVKVLNHFGRVLKLYTFEGGRWMDADTGGPAMPLDESQAGRLAVPPEPAATGATSGRARRLARRKAGAGAPRKPAAARAGKSTGKSGTRKRST